MHFTIYGSNARDNLFSYRKSNFQQVIFTNFTEESDAINYDASESDAIKDPKL